MAQTPPMITNSTGRIAYSWQEALGLGRPPVTHVEKGKFIYAETGRPCSVPEALYQAAAQLNTLTDEAKQLHDSKELFAWIADARRKLAAPQL